MGYMTAPCNYYLYNLKKNPKGKVTLKKEENLLHHCHRID